MPLSRQHLIGGGLSLALGLALLLWLIPDWVEPDPDLRLPVSLVPQIIGVGFVLCGVAVLVQGVFSRPAAQPAQEAFDPPEQRGLLLMILLLLAATIGFQHLHFLIVAPALVAVSMWMFGPLRPVSLILTSALGPLLVWFVGTDVLGRVLP